MTLGGKICSIWYLFEKYFFGCLRTWNDSFLFRWKSQLATDLFGRKNETLKIWPFFNKDIYCKNLYVFYLDIWYFNWYSNPRPFSIVLGLVWNGEASRIWFEKPWVPIRYLEGTHHYISLIYVGLSKRTRGDPGSWGLPNALLVS